MVFDLKKIFSKEKSSRFSATTKLEISRKRLRGL